MLPYSNIYSDILLHPGNTNETLYSMPHLIYAISDLHLSLSGAKPMHIFGEAWRDHDVRIAENWDSMINPEDIVLVCGDNSWAIRFEEAKPDLDWIAQRPGKKIVIRGNHDYWWRRESTNRIQKQIDPSIQLLQGKGIVIGNIGITGTRGWRIEQGEDAEAGNGRVMRRELMYLERGLNELPPDIEKKIVMLHYPPYNADLEPNEFADILQAYQVDMVVFGHIHTGYYIEGNVNGVEYRLASADHTDFKPILISQTN